MGDAGFENLNELFFVSTEKFSSFPAIGTKKGDRFEWVTYLQLKRLVARARSGLAARGVERGDRVAIISDNRLEWAVLAFATYGLGAAYVPMYEAQHPRQWEFILEDAEVKLVFGATESIVRTLEEIASRVSTLEQVGGLALPVEDQRSYLALLEQDATTSVDPVSVDPDTLASIIYTSGTTADPKGVCLSHANLASNVQGALQRFDFRKGDSSLAFLPWAHVFGQTCELYSLLGAGAAIALNDEIPQLIPNLAVVRPTVLVAVPRIFNRIYDRVNQQMAERPAPIRRLFQSTLRRAARARRGERLNVVDQAVLQMGDRLIFSKVRERFGGRLRFVVSGSAALSPAVAEFIDALGIEVFEGYGLSETSPVIAANYPGHRKIGTVGPAFPGVEIRIDHESTEDSKHGEIVVRGPNVMLGYYKNAEATRREFTHDGWFRTGDMGYLDEEGFLHITGRIKEQYKLENGKYVVPSPLEEQLKLSPYIANIMIHGANRAYNVALVVVDVGQLTPWAEQNGVPTDQLAGHEDVRKLIANELEKFSTDFKGYERVKKFMWTTEDFTTENDLLTPKLSLKRRNVLARYGEQLESLYDT